MLSKRTHPMIGKISELLVGGVNRSGAAPFFDVLMTSPRSPLDFKILPQISQRNSSKRFYDDNLGGSVGLGIVAALENSSNRLIMRSVPSQSSRSDPVQFMNRDGTTDDDEDDEEMFEMDEEEEDYTLVTCHHGTNGSCSTRVYDKDGFECSESKINEDHRRERLFVVDVCSESPQNSFQGLGFLSSCYLCRKKLHGRDIFIYRGEKAFCSTECRSSHIANEERKERCRSKFSTSPYTAGQIFSTGVLVT